jgi:hypothetical protein
VTPPENDPTIADADTLLRRVPNRPRMVAREANGQIRPSSAALELREDETACSVDVLERTVAPERPLDVMVGYDERWGLASCTAGAAREEDRHRVVGDPIEDNAAHALIVPTAESRAAQKRNFSTLARRMTFVRNPELPSG